MAKHFESRRKLQRKSGRRSWFRRWGKTLLVLAIVAAAVLSGWLQNRGPPEDGTAVAMRFDQCGTRGRGSHCTSDGDTVTIGYGNTARRIRLTGFDAPEIDGACAAERAKAREAEQALREWLNRGAFEWDGGASPPRDQYGRELRMAWRSGANGEIEYLSQYMIDSGLAEGDAMWERRNWCG